MWQPTTFLLPGQDTVVFPVKVLLTISIPYFINQNEKLIGLIVPSSSKNQYLIESTHPPTKLKIFKLNFLITVQNFTYVFYVKFVNFFL
jgi:hypothetical protein